MIKEDRKEGGCDGGKKRRNDEESEFRSKGRENRMIDKKGMGGK